MSASPAMQSWQSAFDARVEATARQREAFANFLSVGLPTPKSDAWKYTDLRRLTLRQFELARGSERAPTTLLDFEYGVLWVDGAIRRAGATHPGIKLTVGAAAHPLHARAHDPRRTSFDYLNEALAQDTVSIDIDGEIAEPLYIAYAWTEGAKHQMMHPRMSIRLGAGAKATIVEHTLGADDAGHLTTVSTTITLAERAELEHVRLQEDGGANFNVADLRIRVARGGSYSNHNYVLGASLSRTDIDVVLEGEEARTELHGLVLARNTQHLDVRTCIEHRAPHTMSREDYRGIADQRGRVVFNGKVIVVEDAQRTDAAQSSRNLLLSPHAEVDTRPELEIYANDVKCAHGATVGQLDAAALFYLQSRGIGKEEARALLTHAFAAEIIDRVPIQAVHTRLVDQLMRRMPGESS